MPIDSDAQTQLVELAQLRLSRRGAAEPLSRDEIARTVDQLLAAFPEWRDRISLESVLATLGSLFSTFVGEESVLRADDNHALWLDGRRDQIEWRLWERYRTHLIRKQMPQTAINALGRVTDRTLELLGDPSGSGLFDRRGMVVGDVQSGKTGNYTGLVCKAVDAGYKVIIVLTGMNNNLRSQTQVRLDEGFIGKISVPMDEATSRFVGVGEIDPSVIVDWGTNRTEKGDFNYRAMSQFGIHPGGRPLLLVVKKNGSVLNGVLEWIRSTANSSDQQGPRFAHMPLLIIDDEADQASIDTKQQGFSGGVADPDHQPSRINSRIRQILGRFDQVSYVGYTATPFANIFIHPDAETGKEFQDLFPRDFIINIPAPDTYVGPSRLFGSAVDEESGEAKPGLSVLIEEVDDHAASTARRETRGWMPPVHKTDHIPRYDSLERVPPSLARAIESFALVVAARRVRGQGREHNSMLIHVTRWKAVQRLVVQQIHESLDALANSIRYGGSEGMQRLRDRWETDFAPVTAELALPDCAPVTWDEVETALRATVESIRIREINGSSADVLDYEQNRENGLNVIAIGGDKLARGLTLEGLSISYFLRGTTMYDTLMQMGRWFGYRQGYLDLCRLFTTADLVEWYEHIAIASEELRREFDRMEAIRARPIDFGLRVRSHPTLTVTSRAKMRHGTKLRVSFAGDVSETTVFATDERTLQANMDAADDLISRLRASDAVYQANPEQARDGRSHRWDGSHLWSGASSDAVLTFLDRFSTHEDASRASANVLARYIRRQVQLGELTHWNVLLVGGEGRDAVTIGSIEINSVLRRPKGGYGAEPPWLTIAGGERFVIRRLLNPRDEAIDIGAAGYAGAMAETIANPPKRRRADDDHAPAQPSGIYLRRQRAVDTGLLLLYPLSRSVLLGSDDARVEHRLLDAAVSPIGIGISFPASSRAQSVSYVVNNIYASDDDAEGET
jgi:hypothetical protein